MDVSSYEWYICLLRLAVALFSTHTYTITCHPSPTISGSHSMLCLCTFLLPVHSILQQIVCIYAFPLHLFELTLKHYIFFTRNKCRRRPVYHKSTCVCICICVLLPHANYAFMCVCWRTDIDGCKSIQEEEKRGKTV